MTTLVSSFEEEMALENKNHAWHRQKRADFREREYGFVASACYLITHRGKTTVMSYPLATLNARRRLGIMISTLANQICGSESIRLLSNT